MVRYNKRTVNELLDISRNELKNLSPGEIFLVRDLFKGYEWNRISRRDRLLLETLFLNYVKTVNIRIIPIKRLRLGSRDIKTPLF